MNLSNLFLRNFQKYYQVLLLAILLVSASCKKQKLQKSDTEGLLTKTEATKDSLVANVPIPETPQTVPVQNPKTEEDLKSKIDEIDFEYLSSQSKISFKSKDQNIDDANISFRMKKDSIIWFNVRVAILDVARGIITQKGISLMDMYHKTAYQFNYDSLSKQFGVKLDFGLIQSVIVGNMPIRKKPREVRREKDYLLLKQNEGKIMVDNYIGEGNRKLKKLLVQDQPTQNTLKMEYDDFQSLNAFLFPYNNLLTLDYQSDTDKLFYQTVIRIKHKKVELPSQPLTFPFVIPASYDRK